MAPLACCPRRVAAAAAALVVLCSVQVTLVAAVSATEFSTTEQTNTLKLLQGIAAVNPSLAALWMSADFCTWMYVNCAAVTYSPMVYFGGSTGSVPHIVLPELDASVVGSQVIFKGFHAFGDATSPFVAGTLPYSWGRLTRMQVLDFRHNSLKGTLPAAWSALTNLLGLAVQSNSFSGTLPSSWSGMASLQILYASANTFTGSIPSQ